MLILGAVYGIVLLTILINGKTYVQYRKKIHLYYLFYLCGIFFHLVLRTETDLGYAAHHSVNHLAMVVAVVFSRHYLQTKYYLPRLDRLLIGYKILLVVSLLARLYGDLGWLWEVISLTGILLLVFCAWRIFLLGYRPAALFLTAEAATYAGYLLSFVLRTAGFDALGEQVLPIGLAVSTIVFSLGMGERERFYAQARMQWQRQAGRLELTANRENRSKAAINPQDRMIQIHTFGGLKIYREGLELVSNRRNPKYEQLLKFLLAAGPRGIEMEVLCGYLWPNINLLHSQKTLKTTIQRLRAWLIKEAVVVHCGKVSINEGIAWVDCFEYSRRCETLPVSGTNKFKKLPVDEFYQGDFLPEDVHPYIVQTRKHYQCCLAELEHLHDKENVGAAILADR